MGGLLIKEFLICFDSHFFSFTSVRKRDIPGKKRG